jgi:hypothetical protein
MNAKNIPNSLTITINTSVPGFQTIRYKPSNTIPNISKDDNIIWFNPLVPLKKEVINTVPPNITIMEFFDKGLFNSLINAHGIQPKIDLLQAKKKGIIDNNILTTLNILFPVNGLLYIKNEPYAIADVQWTKGDWKVDRKTIDIPQIDINKITNPLLYNNMIKNEILNGNKELEQLPPELLHGSNFDTSSDPNFNLEIERLKKDRLEKEKLVNDKLEKDKLEKDKLEKDKLEKDKLEKEKKRLQEEESQKLADLKKMYETKLLAIENNKQITSDVKPQQLLITDDYKKNILLIDNGYKTKINEIDNSIKQLPEFSKPEISKPQILAITNEPKIEDIIEVPMSSNFKPALTNSISSTQILRRYFLNDIFYFLINQIFVHMTEREKQFVRSIFKITTNVDVSNLGTNISKAAYKLTITGIKSVNKVGKTSNITLSKGLRVIKNSGGGDCLFIAVSDAINYYNYYNSIDKKIMYTIYGNGNNIFTPSILRNIVSNEIIKLYNSSQEQKTAFLDIAEINKDELNKKFEQAIKDTEKITSQLTSDYYYTTLKDLYNGNDNFFVIIPDKIENRYSPFKVITNETDIKKYIESSNYWADEKTINIINKILKINIIVIKNEKNKITIPYPNIKSNDNNNWNKYLFLYNYDNTHYELITFDYIKQNKRVDPETKKVLSIKNDAITTTIFERGNELVPPLYIIFLLFPTYFIKLDTENKQNVVLFKQYLFAINESYKKIINNIEKYETDPSVISKEEYDSDKNFLDNFNKYFGILDKSIVGGQNSFLKKEEKQDNSNISFHIIIDMELQKGKTLSKEQIASLKCVHSWNKVRKSYSDFSGKKYVIPPIYSNLSDKYSKNYAINPNNPSNPNNKLSTHNNTIKNNDTIKHNNQINNNHNNTIKNNDTIKHNNQINNTHKGGRRKNITKKIKLY